MNLNRRRFLAASTAFAALFCLAGSGAIPAAVQSMLEERLPLSFFATPRATRAAKVYPLVSMMKRQYTKNMSVNVEQDELVLLEFSPDKKVVNVAYPVGSSGDYLTGWFKTEDVLDLGQLKLTPPVDYVAPTGTVRHFLYQPRATGAPNLVGCARNMDGALKCGERRVKKGARGREEDIYTLLCLPAGNRTLGEHQLAARLVLARAIPAFKEENYRALVEQMGSEYAFRTGRFWDNSTHPIVVNSGNGGCAAFATDFAGYIFDAHNFNSGERYDDPNEIRSGDVLALKGHFITVVERYPDGHLLTWDGNCNSSIRRTSGAYSIVDGKFHGAEFLNGWHYLTKELTPVGGEKNRKTKTKSTKKK